MVLVRLLVGFYQNSRLSSEYIYRRITPIVRYRYSDNKEKLHLYCILSICVFVLIVRGVRGRRYNR